MSVYVGIDVHRKRSQVAVVAEDGTVQLNKNTVNGTEPLLRLIGDLPAGTPVAFEAAFGWGWLLRLLEDYGFDSHLVHPLQCKAIASARLKNDKVDAATLGGAAAGGGPAARGVRSPRRRCASSGRCCGTRRAGPAGHPSSVTGSTRWWPISATTGPAATCPGPGPRLAGRAGPARGVAGGRRRLPGGDRRAGAGDRLDRRRAARPTPRPTRGSRP